MLPKILIFSLSLIIIDILWIRLHMLPKYINWFNSINLKITYNYVSIILVYFIMILVYPLFIQNKDKNKELLKAALIGSIIYGLYAFTVAGIFPKYGITFAVQEVLWGAFLYTIATFITQQLS